MYNKTEKIEYNIGQLSKALKKGDTLASKLIFRRICFILVILISFILIYILNILHPLFGDDWVYSMLPDAHTKVVGVKDILETQYKHYFTWGGRSVVHIIAQSLLLIGEHSADFINSLAYVTLTLVIYCIANQNNTTRPSLLIAINMMIWFFQPAFGSTILWITGSANYLWGTLIILLFILPYIRSFYKTVDSSKRQVTKTIFMFFFGVIAGWTNENMAVALICVLVIFIVYYRVNPSFYKIPNWAISGLIGATTGAIFMIAAPGNYARMTMIEGGVHQSSIAIYISQFCASIASFYYYALSATFILFSLFVIYKYYKKESSYKPVFLAIVFFLGAIIATLAMSASPIFPGRASFGLNTFIFIAIAILFANFDFRKGLVKGLTYTVLIYALLVFVADYKRSIDVLKEMKQHYKERLQIIENGKKNGQQDFILDDRLELENKTLHYYELTPDSANWHNRMYSGYYNIHSIIVK